MAENTNWDFSRLAAEDSRFDKDCNPDSPLEITPDWGSSISLFTVGQEGGVDFVNSSAGLVDNFINEFFVKPDNPNGVMINTLTDQFTDYYRHHQDKTIIYYRDRYGDSKNPNVNKMQIHPHIHEQYPGDPERREILEKQKVGTIQNHPPGNGHPLFRFR